MLAPPDGYEDPYNDGYPEEDDPRFIGDEWKRESKKDPQAPCASGGSLRPCTQDGLPIPADVLEWYATVSERWVRTQLFTDGGRGPWGDKFVRWFGSRRAEFLVYERCGEGFSMWGGWRLNESAMWEALAAADTDLGYVEPKEELRQPAATPVEAIPPGEPFTEADVDTALARLQTERAPEEGWAGAVLRRSGDPTDAFHAMRDRIRNHTPVRCYCCGSYFRKVGGIKVLHLAHCPDCKADGKKRCPDCEMVFHPRHGKVKRCDDCLARDAEYAAKRNHRHH